MASSRFTAYFVLTGVGLLTSGCSALYGQTTTAGARPFPMKYETVDLVHLLDPRGDAARLHAAEWATLDQGQQIDLAFDQYHQTFRNQDPAAQVASRDEIQERILGASNQLCHQYQQYMQNANSSGNFALGFLTTTTAAAAAIVTGGTSQILAGTAAAASGTRAEFNQDYFYDETVSTIFRGIDAAREREYTQIIQRRREPPLPNGTTPTTADTTFKPEISIANYPIEAAVKDAIQYHAKCSLVTGVEELGDSVRLAQNPGLDVIKQTLFKVNAARQAVIQNATSDQDLALGSIGVPSAAGAATASRSPVAAYGELIQSIESGKSDFAARMKRLTRWPDGVTTRDSLIATINDRATRAETQLADAGCKTSVLDTSKAIDAANLNLANATTDEERATANSALNSEIFKAQAAINDLRLAVDSFNQDVSLLRDTVEASNRAAALVGPDAKMDVSSFAAKIATVGTHPTAAQKLACQN